MKYSRYFESRPVLPSEPVSSLSVRTVTAVYSGSSQSRIAISAGYAHTLSSWPYAPISERSKPMSQAGNAGTASSSALRKSSSTMPYFSLRMLRILSFTASADSVLSKGREPIRILRLSPLMPSAIVLLI